MFGSFDVWQDKPVNLETREPICVASSVFECVPHAKFAERERSNRSIRLMRLSASRRGAEGGSGCLTQSSLSPRSFYGFLTMKISYEFKSSNQTIIQSSNGISASPRLCVYSPLRKVRKSLLRKGCLTR